MKRESRPHSPIKKVSLAARRHSPFVPQLPSLCSPAREFHVLLQSPPARKPGKVRLSKRQLAPADLPKQATSFDLPIAIGILVGAEQLESDVLEQYAAVGELSLEGQMRNVKGVLSIAIAAAKQPGIRGLLVPTENAQEAAVVEGLDIIPIGSLNEAVAFLSGKLQIEPVPSRLNEIYEAFSKYDVDFSDVRGQEMSKRALTIAAAGAHNLIQMLGNFA